MERNVTLQALQRMPVYLNHLLSINRSENANVSAKSIASALGLGEIQVRKDLASVSDKGRPKTGYNIDELINDIEDSLGYNSSNNAVLVGAGKLGKALMSYKGFNEYGLNIVAAFDSNPSACGTDESGKTVYPLEKLTGFCKENFIGIGIITVPSQHAQTICNELISSGIKAIWNFAPTHLCAPDGVYVKNENMAASLALLSNHLRNNENK